MDGTMTGTTEKATGSRRAARMTCAFALAAALLSPGKGWSMAADGALITNIVAATYHGMAGYPSAVQPYLPRYTMSYLATATILVSCPVVAITKRASTSVQAVAGTVTFEICAINSSLQASAWNITITDRLMDNMAYAGGSYLSWVPAGSAPWFNTVSANNTTWSGTGVQPVNNQGTPYYLRWTIDKLGPGRSACISFQTTVI